MINLKEKPLIGLTMGDPVGIGPEILVAALTDPFVYKICRPVIIGDLITIKKALKLKGISAQTNVIDSINKGIFSLNTIDIYQIGEKGFNNFSPACPNADTGKAMIEYILKGVSLAKKNLIDALVTCPITKTAMLLAGSKFHGHTELIASETDTEEYAMMLTGKRLKVVLVTIHIPLAEVSLKLDMQSIIKTIRVTHSSLKERFGIKHPKIAVAGLNPHAGEDSMFGKEEENIILPAVKFTKNEGLDISGPLPPDTVFYQASLGKFDAVVSMYHDQGLAPFKMLHFKDGVNTTIGLPIIRTSVDHGTAYDIAFKGIADHSSLLSAIEMAVLQANNSLN